MLFIAHRGNYNGINKDRENSPDYVDEALALGYDVELDLRIVDGKFYLGHDEPQYLIDGEWLMNRQEHIWIHCKNLYAFEWAILNRLAHAFAHDKDDFTLTTCNKIWTYPGRPVVSSSIIVLFEGDVLPKDCYGYCADIKI
jgi:hypothetical protein